MGRGAVAFTVEIRELAVDERLLADRGQCAAIGIAIRARATPDFPIQHAD
jgi:hypothetical protein